jgi:threonine synthase
VQATGIISMLSAGNMTIRFACEECGEPYPVEGVPYCCPSCGGVFSILVSPSTDPVIKIPGETGIWGYRNSFGFIGGIESISLGEGNTPLVWVKVNGRSVGFKCEFLNPTGSFKDRGSSLITTFLKSRGVMEAVEDSSGNAGASFSAYAARGGIKARVYVPDSASGPKRRQIEKYGAVLVPVKGTRSQVTEAALKMVHTGIPYASHAYLPFNIPGYATLAYEIYNQLNAMPGAVIVPLGQGGLLLGIAFGFNMLRIGNNLPMPELIGVQAQACAPFWNFMYGRQVDKFKEQAHTLAEGVKVSHPIRKEAVLKEVRDSHGSICIVEEDDILTARDDLAQMGFHVEPTSAIVWPTLKKEMEKLPDPIIVILTGSGLKYG